MMYILYARLGFTESSWISAKSFRKVMRAMPSLANGQGLQWLQGAVGAKWCNWKDEGKPQRRCGNAFFNG